MAESGHGGVTPRPKEDFRRKNRLHQKNLLKKKFANHLLTMSLEGGKWFWRDQSRRHCTMAVNAAVLLGLRRNELAPRSKARSTSSGRMEAVMTITERRLNFGWARTQAKTSKPFFFGMFKSKRTIEGMG